MINTTKILGMVCLMMSGYTVGTVIEYLSPSPRLWSNTSCYLNLIIALLLVVAGVLQLTETKKDNKAAKPSAI